MTSNEVSNKDDGSEVVVEEEEEEEEEENRDDCRAKAVLLEVLLAFCKVRRAVLDKTAKDDDDEGNEQATKNMIAAFVAVFMKDIYIGESCNRGQREGRGGQEKREREGGPQRGDGVNLRNDRIDGINGMDGWVDSAALWSATAGF